MAKAKRKPRSLPRAAVSTGWYGLWQKAASVDKNVRDEAEKNLEVAQAWRSGGDRTRGNPRAGSRKPRMRKPTSR